MIILLLALQAAPAATPKSAPTLQDRFERCIDLATGGEAEAGIAAANTWSINGGGFLAQQCLGMANATLGRFPASAQAFEAAARAAEVAKDRRAANYWAQAGNAWLAARDGRHAQAALDAALAAGTLSGLSLGEAYLDRARTDVLAGDSGAARRDIDRALTLAADDPLAWLLSATLARRGGDLARAKSDIAQALKRSPDDAAVELEAGNIAALAGDAAAAKAAWGVAAAKGGDSPAAASARIALAQFDAAPATGK